MKEEINERRLNQFIGDFSIFKCRKNTESKNPKVVKFKMCSV